jgi:hypothetical protein
MEKYAAIFLVISLKIEKKLVTVSRKISAGGYPFK